MGNHLFVIFAVLDVSCAVNSYINHSFFTFIIYIDSSLRSVHCTRWVNDMLGWTSGHGKGKMAGRCQFTY